MTGQSADTSIELTDEILAAAAEARARTTAAAELQRMAEEAALERAQAVNRLVELSNQTVAAALLDVKQPIISRLVSRARRAARETRSAGQAPAGTRVDQPQGADHV